MISKVTFTPPTTGASAVTLHDPANNTERYLSKIDGVVGPPAPRDVTRVRPGVDGIVDATAYFDARTITLEGELWKSTGGASLSDLSTISQAFSDSLLSPGRLEVTYENGTVRWCNCKLAGPIETSVEGASRLVQYQVQLRASDPRWYAGPYATAKQSVTLPVTPTSGPTGGVYYTLGPTAASNLVNGGTAPSPPLLTIDTGSSDVVDLLRVTVTPPSAYQSIAQGGASLVFEWDVATSTTITSGGKATLNSATREFTLVTGSWDVRPSAASEFPMLYPGTSTAVWTAVNTAGTAALASMICKFEWFDAYW